MDLYTGHRLIKKTPAFNPPKVKLSAPASAQQAAHVVRSTAALYHANAASHLAPCRSRTRRGHAHTRRLPEAAEKVKGQLYADVRACSVAVAVPAGEEAPRSVQEGADRAW